VARIRTIKPELFEDEALGDCSRDARFLFVGLISHSDDHGRQRGNARLVKANVFPYDEDIGRPEVERWLGELIQAGVIRMYESAQEKFIQIVNWRRHQRVDKIKESEFPDPLTHPDTSMDSGGSSSGATIPADGATEGNGRDQGREATTSLVEVVFKYWQERCGHPKTTLDPKRHRAIRGRLKEGATLDELKMAVDGAARAAYVNDVGHRFDDIELICRDRPKLDSFIARVSATPPNAATDAAVLAQALKVVA
jgi:hypothetical protein